jgi:NDP-sugar pyrophosphorylase family protein
MQPTLLVLAAGLGSRYGSLKQIEPVGPGGEAIIDYSVYDAMRAGFGKVVFVIKKDIENDFRESLLKRFENRIKTSYVFQELDMLPEGYSLPPERKKPWGTAHALMAADGAIDTPFAAINADDFYGLEAFQGIANFLSGKANDDTDYCMIGYKLRNTLSEHGTVSRGVCQTDQNKFLAGITEITRIRRENGRIVYFDNDKPHNLSEEAVVSMNMWGFTPAVFRQLKDKFTLFLDKKIHDPGAEYFIPIPVDQLISEGSARVRVVDCDASWFGITYREDRETVRKNILERVDKGIYPANLWD